MWVTGTVLVLLGWCAFTVGLHVSSTILTPLAVGLLLVGVPLLSVGLSGLNQEAMFEEAVEQLRAELYKTGELSTKMKTSTAV